MRIYLHDSVDWCHLCGKRSSPLADIWYPENAEHDRGNTKYVRICVPCGEKIATITTLQKLWGVT